MRRFPAVVACLALVASLPGCTRKSDQPPQPQVPLLKGPDGREYVLLARANYKPVYDAQGHLEKVEYDRNADGKPDQIAWHRGARIPNLVEEDDDFDGAPDRWAYYNPSGVLIKVGYARKGSKPDTWAFYTNDGKLRKQEYDDDGDGTPDRTEIVKDGKVVAIEVDADRDGRTDRWQVPGAGRLSYEDLDTDGDGKPDKRLRYGPKGEVVGLEPLPVK
jgi:hypothetical protein